MSGLQVLLTMLLAGLAAVFLMFVLLAGEHPEAAQAVRSAPAVTPIPTPTPTPMPTLRVMFYETEIKTDCTLWPVDPIELNARISPEIAAGAEFEWKTDNPSVLRAEKTGPGTANITCIDDGTLPQTCKLTVSCAGFEKELTVYCRR